MYKRAPYKVTMPAGYEIEIPRGTFPFDTELFSAAGDKTLTMASLADELAKAENACATAETSRAFLRGLMAKALTDVGDE